MQIDGDDLFGLVVVEDGDDAVEQRAVGLLAPGFLGYGVRLLVLSPRINVPS